MNKYTAEMATLVDIKATVNRIEENQVKILAAIHKAMDRITECDALNVAEMERRIVEQIAKIKP